MNTVCDYCLKNCKIGIDATVLDGNMMCRECEESEVAGNG